MNTLVYTVITDGVDELMPPIRHDHSTDYIVFTDDMSIGVPTPWKAVELHSFDSDPFVQIKGMKMLQNRIFEQYDRSIWVDGNIRLKMTASELFAFTKNTPMAMFEHGHRVCAWKELEECCSRNGRFRNRVRQGRELLTGTQHPENWGLWMTGLIVRHHLKSVLDFHRRWFELCKNWTWRDQIALPVAVRQTEFVIHTIPHRLADTVFKPMNHAKEY